MFVNLGEANRLPRIFITIFALGAMLWALGACAPVPERTASPTLEVITVQYTPAVRSLQPLLAQCANQTPGAGLVLHEISAPNLNLSAANLTLRLGEPPTPASYSASLVSSDLTLIAHPNHPQDEISLRDLSNLYARQPSGEEPEDQIYTYQPGDDLRQAIEAFLGQSAGRLTREVPTVQAVLETVSTNEKAIGFLPTSPDNPEIKIIEITGVDPEQLHIPLLALSDEEPTGLTRSFLACLQTNFTSTTR